MSDSTSTPSAPADLAEGATTTQSPDPSHQITVQDIYFPIKSASPEDESGESLSDKDKTLYVSDLDQDVDEADLFKIFSQYGKVLSIHVVKDSATKKSLGYAYVNYQEKEDGKWMGFD